jgi:hypothetical protein
MVTVPAGMAAAAPEADGDAAKPAIDFLLNGANGQLTPEALLALPAIEIPQPVREALEQLGDVVALPEGCLGGVVDALELILNGVIELPLELVDALAGLLELLAGLGEGLPEIPVLTDLVEFLEGLPGLGGAIEPVSPADDALVVSGTETGAGATPAVTEEEVLAEGEMELPTVIQGLVALGETLVGCLVPPTEEPEPEPEPENPPVVQPEPEQPAPPAAQPVAAPLSYPGYAPTGADTARADDVSVPLTALGGGLVLVAAGAAGYGMRGRAVRTRD